MSGGNNLAPKGFDEDFFAASARDWRRGLEQRRFSARELLEAVWDRILLRNPAINALAAYDYEAAARAADVADARLARGEGRPLEGLPITVKDSFETAGTRRQAAAPKNWPNIARKRTLSPWRGCARRGRSFSPRAMFPG